MPCVVIGYKLPLKANEILPVSSETTIIKASLTSLNPNAALCLVPNFFSPYKVLIEVRHLQPSQFDFDLLKRHHHEEGFQERK